VCYYCGYIYYVSEILLISNIRGIIVKLKYFFRKIIIIFFVVILTTLKIIYAGNPPDFSKSSLTPSSSGSNEVIADGSTQAHLTLTLKDSTGTALAGDTVSLSASNVSFGQNNVQLDSNGQYNFTLTSTTVGTFQISVTDTTTSTVLNNLGTVIFDPLQSPTPTVSPTPSITPTPTSSANICNNSPPGSAPKLTSATALGAHQIKLTWTIASDPVTYYLLSYGQKSGQYIYGNPNIGPQGTISYIVSNLATGTKYYFVIRAGNGCAPGSFSNELSETTTGGIIIPTPTVDENASDQNTDNTDQNSDMPMVTDTPLPDLTITPDIQPASSSGSLTGKIVLVGSLVGVVLLFLAIFLFINMNKKPKVKVEILDDKQADSNPN
jgi:hypothetical protein